ncbi:MAG TPA: hypothetical protein VK784_07680, partial [Pseudonocardiaceae bacterium]|nr:hypothetical protein [Pseudonocardiaceae bacterium]
MSDRRWRARSDAADTRGEDPPGAHPTFERSGPAQGCSAIAAQIANDPWRLILYRSFDARVVGLGVRRGGDEAAHGHGEGRAVLARASRRAALLGSRI